jgi:hypothetical protein
MKKITKKELIKRCRKVIKKSIEKMLELELFISDCISTHWAKEENKDNERLSGFFDIEELECEEIEITISKSLCQHIDNYIKKDMEEALNFDEIIEKIGDKIYPHEEYKIGDEDYVSI